MEQANRRLTPDDAISTPDVPPARIPPELQAAAVEPPAAWVAGMRSDAGAAAGAQADRGNSASGQSGEASLFGSLDADQRIRADVEQHERTLWASAGAITLLYAALIASQLLLGAGAGSMAEIEQRQKERRGQDGADSINVEIVPEPDFNAKTKKWRDGAEQQSPTPSPMPPQPQQQPSEAQPEIKGTVEAEDEKEKPKEEEAEEAGQPALDIEALVDAAAADFAEQIDRAFRKRPQKAAPERQAMMSGGGEMKVRGQGAGGKSDAFTRSVIAALMKTAPWAVRADGTGAGLLRDLAVGRPQLRARGALERQPGDRQGRGRRHPQGEVRGAPTRHVARPAHLHHRLRVRLHPLSPCPLAWGEG